MSGYLPRQTLITGASAGIGLAMAQALARQHAESSPHKSTAATEDDSRPWQLHLASREASNSPALEKLSKAHAGQIHRYDIDLADESSLSGMVEQIKQQTPTLDLCINTIGLLHDDDMQPEKRLAQVSAETLQRSFTVNAIGVALLAKQLMPLIPKKQRFVFASLSARVGSIEDNRLGGWYAYRASKAAQNMLLRTLAIEWKRSYKQSICVALHPGTTDTALSKPFQANVRPAQLQSPVQTATMLLTVIGKLSPENSGQFLAYDGQAIPW